MVITHDYKAMSFQKKQTFPLRLYSLASLACPQSEGFYLQTGPKFLFYLAAFLAENFSGTQRKAYKTQSNFTNTSEAVREPDRIFPYNFLTLWHNSNSSPSPGQDYSVRTQDVHGNLLHLRPANEVKWQAPLCADAFSFIKQSLSIVCQKTRYRRKVGLRLAD